MLFLLLLALFLSPGAAAGPILRLGLHEGWSFTDQGPWAVQRDRRDLIAMRHPWEASAKGNYASAACRVTIPAEWTGPVYLSFYCSDDYHTDTWRPDGTPISAEGFIGHRYKQVLVDGRVVWNADVSDSVQPEAGLVQRVEVPAQPGQTIMITALAYDAVASDEVLAEDFFQAAPGAPPRGDNPAAKRFASCIYWGDFVLLQGDAEAPAAARPSALAVAQQHEARWPLPTPPVEVPSEGVVLQVSGLEALAERAVPLRFGVPLPEGRVIDPGQVAFFLGTTPLYVQKQPYQRWLDGSIRWLTCDTLVPGGSGELRMRFAEDRAKTKASWSTTPDAALPEAVYGKQSLRQSEAGLCAASTADSGIVLEALRIATGDAPAQAVVEEAAWPELGPLRTTLAINGTLENLETPSGRFTLYATMWSGTPWLRVWLRWFNDTGRPLPVSAYTLSLRLPSPVQEWDTPHGSVDAAFTLDQLQADQRRLNGTRCDPALPVYLAWSGGTLHLPQARERYPITIRAEEDIVSLSLVSAPERPVVFQPGEALSHEIWFRLSNEPTGDTSAFAHLLEAPPAVLNPAYYCASGAMGPAAPLETVPAVLESLVADFGGKSWTQLGMQLGVRDFPDAPIFGPEQWANNYYERVWSLWSLWVATGDPEWFRRARDVSRHVSDRAIVHAAVPGTDWLGALHGPGRGHTPGPWIPGLRAGGFALYGALTGDEEARRTALGISDYAVRTGAGLDAASLRAHAAPFEAIVTAYELTGDLGFLDEGSLRIARMLARTDARRGAWPEGFGSAVYRGTVPWFAGEAAQPLYRWYRATGDVGAAQLLVGMADAVLAESSDWQRPERLRTLEYAPHANDTGEMLPFLLPLLFAAAELSSEPYFAEAAQASWAAWQRNPTLGSPLDFFWHWPWLCHYLRKLPAEDAAHNGRGLP